MTASTWLTPPLAAPVPAHPQLRGLVTSCRQSWTGYSRPGPWPASSVSHHTKGSPPVQPHKGLPCASVPQPFPRHVLALCALPTPADLVGSALPSSLCPFPDAVPLFLTGYSRASFFCPSAKDKGLLTSAMVILVTSGSWAVGAGPVHGRCKVDACPRL